MEDKPSDFESLITVAGATDRGLIRPSNQDSYAVLRGRGLPAWCLAVAGVFDGVGGTAHGGEASLRAARYLGEALRRPSLEAADRGSPEEVLAHLIQYLHQRLRADGRKDPALKGMSTTAAVALLVRGPLPVVAIGHVGDSPAFLIRHGRMEKLVEEDSLVADLLRAGLLSKTQAEHHPRRHVITQALGQGGEVTPHVRAHTVEPGDCFLLCTDGLTDVVPEPSIREVLLAEQPERACQRLVEAAREAGGTDNITAVVLKFPLDKLRSNCSDLMR